MTQVEKVQKIISLIENKTESEIIDFKREFYHKDKIYDLIKDVLSFANDLNKEEKFIVFGIDEQFDLININYNEVRDISSLNELINEYCEPYIRVELIKFTYNGVSLLALGIADNFDRPYVIKKDFIRNSYTYLRKGEIYLRKGATNLKASREDLDKIYAHREQVELKVKNDKILFRMIQIRGQREKKCCIPILIDNNTKKTIIINSGIVLWGYHDNLISSNIEFIENDESRYKELISINEKPFNIQAHSQYYKLAIFNVGEQFLEIIKNRRNDELTLAIKLFDAFNKEICTSSTIESILFEAE